MFKNECCRQNSQGKFYWEKEKSLGSKDCMWTITASVYWSCSSMVTKDTTPLKPPGAWAEFYFKCTQQTIHDPWGPENIFTMISLSAPWQNGLYKQS